MMATLLVSDPGRGLQHKDIRLVLASGSAARVAMLEAVGLQVLVDPASIDEAEVKASLLTEAASAIAETLACLKAQRVSSRHPDAMVIGADQVLVSGGKIFDKPATLGAARQQLRDLRGRSHELLSAAVVVRDGIRIWHCVDRATLTVRDFSDEFLDRYLAAMADRSLCSVGAYEIEGLGAQLFTDVEGDHFTIRGMPLLKLLGFLRDAGAIIR